MNTKLIRISLIALIVIAASACVTKKKYMEAEDARTKCEQENASLKKENIDLTTVNNELKANLALLKEQNARLVKDSVSLGTSYRDLKDKYDRLNQSYDDLNATMQQNAQLSGAEMKKLLAELQKAQEDLQIKEDRLRKSEGELDVKKSDLEALSKELAEKEKRLNELQGILDKKDSVVNALKNAVMDALTGFVGKGLSVEMKNGKVYVHMDEKLLFSTGSFEVAASGQEALKDLAKVLEENPDINITIEGHTDNVPYKAGSGPINDNWDLSVMRSTAVVKILLKNSKIDPKRITASGRSQFLPVDKANTDAARSKNRRTEIILTPKLDELLKILESN